MSKKRIDERIESLKLKEERIKLQLSKETDEIRGRAKRIGKIALVAGVVAILGYWIFNSFLSEDGKEKKKKKKQSKSSWERLATIATPYLNKFLDGVMKLEEEPSSKDRNKTISEKQP